MPDPIEPRPSTYELYKLFQASAEKVSDRRSQANTWMLSVNSALVAFYAFLEKGKEIISASDRQIWLIAIPLAGFIICMAWASLLVSYRKLNHAKFSVLMEMEKELPYPLYTREGEFLQKNKRWNLSNIEILIPWAFSMLYLFFALSAGWLWIAQKA